MGIKLALMRKKCTLFEASFLFTMQIRNVIQRRAYNECKESEGKPRFSKPAIFARCHHVLRMGEHSEAKLGVLSSSSRKSVEIEPSADPFLR